MDRALINKLDETVKEHPNLRKTGFPISGDELTVFRKYVKDHNNKKREK